MSHRHKHLSDQEKTLRQGTAQSRTGPILVSTTVGNSMLSPESLVYVSVGKNRFLRKAVSDLNEGESVLFSKEVLRGGGTTITLEEVDAVLKQSKRYRYTLPVLFVQCEDGTYTTRFRTTLLEGATNPQSKRFWPPPIKNDPQFALGITGGQASPIGEERLDVAASFIHETLDSIAQQIDYPVVSTAHIRYGWLGGDTLAPRQLENVSKALAIIAPELEELTGSEDFRANYRLYVAIRQGVMRAIWDTLDPNRSRHTVEEKADKGEQQHISIKPEIQLVVDHFITDLTDRHFVVRVVKLQQITPNGKAGPDEHSVLRRGVVTGKLEDPVMTLKTLAQLDIERAVLLELKNRILYDYCEIYHQRGFRGYVGPIAFGVSDHIGDRLGYPGLADLLKWCLDRLKEADVNAYGYAQGNLKADALFRQLANEFVEKLEAGELDALYGLPKGTVYSILDKFFSVVSATPKIKHYYNRLPGVWKGIFLRSQTQRQAISTKNIDREIKRVGEIIRKRYGRFHDATYPIRALGEFAEEDPNFPVAIYNQVYHAKQHPLTVLEGIYGQRAIAAWKELVARDNVLLNDDQVRQILTELGLEVAISIFPFCGEP